MFSLRQSQNHNYCLAPKRIDIWCFSLKMLPTLAYDLLDQEEKHRANRFVFPRHRRRFITAHAVLRVLLSRYLNQDACTLEFTPGVHGKPLVVNNQGLEFNLSHSQDFALIAVGQRTPLGIDLEYFSCRPYEDIAREMYSPEEIQRLIQLPAALKQLAFFNIWSQKEALVKACGIGLGYPTKNFTVPVMPSQHTTSVFDPLHQQWWEINSFMPAFFCNAALCYAPSVQDIFYNAIDPLTLWEEIETPTL